MSATTTPIEVYEISRSAFDALNIHDMCNGCGDYAVVGMRAVFSSVGPLLHVVEYFDAEYWACRRCSGMYSMTLANAQVSSSSVWEYEVWHIVQDSDQLFCGSDSEKPQDFCQGTTSTVSDNAKDISETFEPERDYFAVEMCEGCAVVPEDVTALANGFQQFDTYDKAERFAVRNVCDEMRSVVIWHCWAVGGKYHNEPVRFLRYSGDSDGLNYRSKNFFSSSSPDFSFPTKNGSLLSRLAVVR